MRPLTRERERDDAATAVRVLLVDDQSLVRAGLRMILEAEPGLEVVGECPDGTHVLDSVRRLRPDVVLMDIRMPLMDGIEATRRLLWSAEADTDTPVRVLMLTTSGLDDQVHDALRAGARGFLLKDAPPAQLVEGVRLVAAGDALLAPAITRRVIDQLARMPRADAAPPELVSDLTARELQVLRLIARGLSNAEIAAALVISDTTVKTHVGRVLMKLGVRDRAQAVVAAYECGLVTPRGSSPRTTQAASRPF